MAEEKLTAIKAKDGFSQIDRMSRMDVDQVYEGLDEIGSDSFLKNIFNLQVFWGQKEIARALEKPTFMDDINRLGFDTSLVCSRNFLQHHPVFILFYLAMISIF